MIKREIVSLPLIRQDTYWLNIGTRDANSVHGHCPRLKHKVDGACTWGRPEFYGDVRKVK